MKKVVITGIGMLSSLGVGVDEIWPKIKEGTSGVNFLKKVDASDLKTKFGAEVSEEFNPEDFMDAKEARRSDPFIRFAVAAASLALKDSKLEITDENSHLVGSYIGSGIGGIQTFIMIKDQKECLLSLFHLWCRIWLQGMFQYLII